MIPVILVMHEPLATAFAHCVEHVLGEPQARLHVVDIAADVDVDQASDDLTRLLLRFQPRGSLILCDLYGATPFNIAQRAIAQANATGVPVSLLSGANLYMVLKALTDSASDPESLRTSVRRRVLRGIVGSDHTE